MPSMNTDVPSQTDGIVLSAEPRLGLGERCRVSRRSIAMSQAAGEEAPVSWHAAVTNPGAEFSVRAALQERGIDTVLPTIRFWRIRNRKRLIAERPLLARCVLFGMDRSTQSIVDLVCRYVRDGDNLVARDEPAQARGIAGLERVIRDADGGWACIPTGEIWKLRRQILAGDFDGTLREGRARPELPNFIKALVKRGELSADATLTHRELKTKGLKFSVAA